MKQADSGTALDGQAAGDLAQAGKRERTPWGWGRGRVLASLSALTACLLVFHSAVPNAAGGPGSLLETFLPWLGLVVPTLLGLTLLRRSFVALSALLLPVVAWLSVFGGLLLPGSEQSHDILAVQHNVSDTNPEPADTARALAGTRADLIAVEELTPSVRSAFTASLASEYPHHAVEGTVGLWSRYPLSGTRPVDIKPEAVGDAWNRGLRATALTPQGDVAVYVAHLPSVRLGLHGFSSARRDESAALLGAAIAAERQ
ncbi:MAG TPA: endonuclease/exonuclease/phosphatase family protein, partial [Streptomyces sp.]|nr:endonuclease/exonuclease/phosphatase family protein [Streptomyces sp.]